MAIQSGIDQTIERVRQGNKPMPISGVAQHSPRDIERLLNEIEQLRWRLQEAETKNAGLVADLERMRAEKAQLSKSVVWMPVAEHEERLAELAAAKAQLAAVPIWTPVGEALPAVMLRVLVAVTDGKMRTSTRAYHVADKSVSQDDFGYDGEDNVYDEEADKFYWPAGWYESQLEGECDYRLSGTVTHWMPLPNLPEAKAVQP